MLNFLVDLISVPRDFLGGIDGDSYLIPFYPEDSECHVIVDLHGSAIATKLN
jgi:hypothetical protein